jgi:hypothetical protein
MPALGRNRAGIGEHEIAVESCRAGKDRRDGVRQKTLDPGRHGEIEPPRIALPRQGRIAVGADIGAGGEDDPRDEGIERALAVDVEIDRRQVGKLREMRDQPTFRLLRLDLDGQALGLRHQADLDVDGAGLIEALRREG